MASKNETKLTAEPGRQEFFITREFDAPRELVFKAFTDPEHLKNWLGCREFTMKFDRYVPGSGGSYRYIHIDPQGREFAFHGVRHEETAPERIIQTFEFEGLPERGHVVLETATFEALPGGRTKLTNHSVFQSVDDRNGMMKTGVERGARESHERLDELLAKGF
jgi:uncharacterized protein YndB with AHSA1/START domain